METSVIVNSFVRRQDKLSGKTYSTLSFKKIANYAKAQLEKGIYKSGYRKGVIIINVEEPLINKFICPFTKISDNTILKATITKRRQEEESYIQIRALSGEPLETGSVELILYHHDVLKETNEQESKRGWELISFHAIPKGIDEMPMGPITMMRNQLMLRGGTKGNYSSAEWAESINFWQKFAVLESPTE